MMPPKDSDFINSTPNPGEPFDPDQLAERWAEIQRMEREATEDDDLSDLDEIVSLLTDENA